ncbi:MAG: HupE/UreJ family protein [OM182 bacterium]|nr:MAG: HupE/UreJ family protein [OM182 bacterium]HBK19400.1 hypothetical protein [Gammaproteobacteria bacterium]
MPTPLRWLLGSLLLAALLCLSQGAWGHDVSVEDASFLAKKEGFIFWPYFYLGAKHMFTGLDHLLFLAGVIFFLYRPRDVALYVTLFAIGHSLTLVVGVWFRIPANPYLVDAVIGFSVMYKAFENLGGFKALDLSISSHGAVFFFGLCHGLGLATKLQQITLSDQGLLGNLIAFNLGVEAGQLTALSIMLVVILVWRRRSTFRREATLANAVLVTAGCLLTATQLSYYLGAS